MQSGHPDDRWGFAVQGALSLKTDWIAAGDTLNISAVYTDGATRYNIQNLAGSAGAWTTFSGSNVPGTIGSFGVGFAPDTVFATGGQQQLIQTWGMRGAYNHNWDPYWSSALYGAYAAVQYGSGATTVVCNSILATPTIHLTPGTTCNPNYNVSQIGFITRWTPVKDLTFSVDALWSHLDQRFSGVINTTGGYGTGNYEIKDKNTLQALLRVQRNW